MVFKWIVNNVNAAPNVTIIDPIQIDTVGELVGTGLNILIGIGWAIVFIYLALGFIKYVTSKGEKDKTKEAQETITYAVIGGIGLLLLGSARIIVEGILGTTLPEGYVPEVTGGSNDGGGDPGDYCLQNPSDPQCGRNGEGPR